MKDNRIEPSICSDCENEIPVGYRHVRRRKLLPNGNWLWTHECLQIKLEVVQ